MRHVRLTTCVHDVLAQTPIGNESIKQAIINSLKTKLYMLPKPYCDSAHASLIALENESRFPSFAYIRQYLTEYPALLQLSTSQPSIPVTPPPLQSSASSASLPKIGRERYAHVLIDQAAVGATEMQALLTLANRHADVPIRALQVKVLQRILELCLPNQAISLTALDNCCDADITSMLVAVYELLCKTQEMYVSSCCCSVAVDRLLIGGKHVGGLGTGHKTKLRCLRRPSF
jgi:hypothetical protein